MACFVPTNKQSRQSQREVGLASTLLRGLAARDLSGEISNKLSMKPKLRAGFKERKSSCWLRKGQPEFQVSWKHLLNTLTFPFLQVTKKQDLSQRNPEDTKDFL